MITTDLTDKDLALLVLMAEQMHQESLFKGLDFDRDKMKRFIARAFVDDNYYMAVAKSDGIVIGAIIGQIKDYVFGNDSLAHDHAWYVIPSERGKSSAGLRLLNKFEGWAKTKDAKRIVIGSTTGINTDNFNQLMTKAKYRFLGGLYDKEIS